MIDLKKLEKKIDAFLEAQTKESLEAFLFQERYGKPLNKIIGRSSFISLENRVSSKMQFSYSANKHRFSNSDKNKTETTETILAA